MKVNFKITTACPANCTCCQERLHNFRINYFDTVAQSNIIMRIIRLFEEVGDSKNSISITGGEPSVIDNLPEIVKAFSKEGITVGIDTNGWNVTYDWLRRMEEAELDYVLISLYSLNKASFDKMRGTGDTDLFDRASRAIDALEQLKKEHSSIKVRQQVTLLKDNYQEVPILLENAIERGFDAFSTAYFISASEDSITGMSEADIVNFRQNIIPKVIEVLKNNKMSNEKFHENLKRISSFFEFKGVTIDEVARGYYRPNNDMCNDTNRIVIYPNGDAVPCTAFDYFIEGSKSVNILKSSYSQIVNSHLFIDFWKRPNYMCTRCPNGHQIWIDL